MSQGRWRIAIAALLAALIGIVLWQNLAPARFALLAWRVEAPLAVWVAGAFVLGFATGWLVRHRRG